MTPMDQLTSFDDFFAGFFSTDVLLNGWQILSYLLFSKKY